MYSQPDGPGGYQDYEPGDRGGYPPPSVGAAAYEFMRRVDPNGPGGESSSGDPSTSRSNYSSPRSRSPLVARRPRKTGGVDGSPLRGAIAGGPRRVAAPTMALQSMTSLTAGLQGPEEPVAFTSGNVGVGIYETDSASGEHAQYNTSTSNSSGYDTYDRQQQQQQQHSSYEHNRTTLREASSGGNFLPNAPYQDMLSHYGKEDPSVERARILMASHQGNQQAGRPTVKAGVPQEPNIEVIEPNMPSSRLGRRCLTHRPKRQPDLVRGKVNGNSNNPNMIHVECVACGNILEISKHAIVVYCPTCFEVHHAATCRIRSSH